MCGVSAGRRGAGAVRAPLDRRRQRAGEGRAMGRRGIGRPRPLRPRRPALPAAARHRHHRARLLDARHGRGRSEVGRDRSGFPGAAARAGPAPQRPPGTADGSREPPGTGTRSEAVLVAADGGWSAQDRRGDRGRSARRGRRDHRRKSRISHRLARPTAGTQCRRPFRSGRRRARRPRVRHGRPVAETRRHRPPGPGQPGGRRPHRCGRLAGRPDRRDRRPG